MPNLVAYLHVRLNLNRAEDAEIYQNLGKLPEGERSKMIRIALLAYFKGELGGRERKSKRMKVRQVEPEPRARTQTVPAMKQEEAAAGVIDDNKTSHPAKEDSEEALSDMLDLIQ
jgi:hypothetical protein